MSPHVLHASAGPQLGEDAHASTGHHLPVLIEVPDVRPSTRYRRSSDVPGGAARTGRRRRRLKREVRVAATALALGVPALWLGMGLMGGLTMKPASADEAGVPVDPPAISLSIEPLSVGSDTSGPVARPADYLLPADLTEEGSHGGG